jgi:hypothetical protein
LRNPIQKTISSLLTLSTPLLGAYVLFRIPLQSHNANQQHDGHNPIQTTALSLGFGNRQETQRGDKQIAAEEQCAQIGIVLAWYYTVNTRQNRNSGKE